MASDSEESNVNGHDKRDNLDEDDNDDADLFGSDAGDDLNEPPRKRRQLDDEDLDSGDDENRRDRSPGDAEMQDEQPLHEELSFMDLDLVRHPIPEPTDNELYLLKVPGFLGIEPKAFTQNSFQPPETDHHSKAGPSQTFSAYNTAMTTIRWRHSPTNPLQLQSNARVIRWSDGSFTLQLASKPQNQYAMDASILAPPQHNPQRPTPVTRLERDSKRKGAHGSKYNAEQDTFTYLAAGHQRAEVLRITNKFSAALKVQSATDASAEALERLQHSLAAASNALGDGESSGIGVIKLTEDPELAKKRAEVAEKEKLKAQRRREAQEARDRDRQGRAFGGSSRRSGAGFGTGLTVGSLEDDGELGAGGGPGRPRAQTASQRQRNQARQQRGRRGEIYSDDEEDFGRRGRTREDEYDEEDDFLAPSDEEEEVAESDEDPDDGIVEAPRPGSARRGERAAGGPPAAAARRDATPDSDGGTPAPRATAGSPSAAAAGGGRKRRRVIDEDDEDDDE